MKTSSLALLALLGACASQGSPTSTASTSPFSPPASSSAPPTPSATGRAVSSSMGTVVVGNAKSYQDDPTKAPSSCTDVGEHVGYASCCQGKYCAGWCKSNGECHCGDSSGCLWPEVCGGACVGPHDAVVFSGEPTLTSIPLWALTLEPVTASSMHGKDKQVKIVNEGNTCGLDEPKNQDEVVLKHYDQRQWTCCQGQRCAGYCVTTAANPKPHCECAGVPGGCVSPHLCCGHGTVASCVDEPKCPHPSSPPWPPGGAFSSVDSGT